MNSKTIANIGYGLLLLGLVAAPFLGAYPIFVFVPDADNETGVGLQLGYGATDSLDIEGRAAFYDDVTFVGGDAEVWFLKNQPLDLSARGGFHFGLVEDDNDTRAFDLSLIASAPIASRIELYGALDMAFVSVDDSEDDYTTVHLVPGIEAALSDNLDFLLEFGIAADDDNASDYFAFGLSYYFR